MIFTCVAMALVAGVIPGRYTQKHEITTAHIRIDQDGGASGCSAVRGAESDATDLARSRRQRHGRQVWRAAQIQRRNGISSTGEHTSHGLMRARYKTSDLIGDSLVPFQVPADERIVVRREVTRLAQLHAAGQ